MDDPTRIEPPLPEPVAAVDAAPRRHTALAVAVILGAGAIAYAGAFHGTFVFDDLTGILQNDSIRQLWPPTRALQPPSQTPVAGRPVVNATLALNYAISGLEPWSYHLFNLAVHLLNGLLLFGIVRRALRETESLRRRFGPSATGLALAVALLWLVHPLQSEPVMYTIQRTELVMAFFYLQTLYCVTRGVGTTDHRRAWLGAAVVACALGMASKEVMISAPLIVLLYDRCFVAGSFRGALRARAGLYAALAATWLIPLTLHLGGPRSATAGLVVPAISPQAYGWLQLGVVAHYLRLAFWPQPLLADYGFPSARTAGPIWPAAILIALLVGLTLWALWRRPTVGFLGAWFFLTLAPSSSLVPITTEVAAERRMYLALAAVVTLVVLGSYAAGTALLERAMDPPGTRRRVGRVVGSGALVVLVLLLAVTTWQRSAVYASELAFWQDAAQKRPWNPRALNNLGAILARSGQNEQAIGYFQQTLQLAPEYVQAHYNLGLSMLQQGRPDEAAARFERALELKPTFAAARLQLANVRLQQGRLEEALQSYRQAVDLYAQDPLAGESHVMALVRYGEVLAQSGAVDQAVAVQRQAIQVRPDTAEAHVGLANALVQQGQSRQAAAEYEAALRLKPDLGLARYGWSNLRAQQGDYAGAVSVLREGLLLQPDSVPLRVGLAWQLATSPDAQVRNGAEAVTLAEQAAQARANRPSADVLRTLAAAYAEAGRFEEATQTAERALEIARQAGNAALVAAVTEQLQQLRAGQPFRQTTAPR